jgi:WD40 repeat protein
LSVAFSPDSRSLASASEDKTVRVWQLATGKEIQLLQGHEGAVLSIAFSPDARSLASASKDKTIRLWQLATGNEICSFQGHEGPVRRIAFSPDGRVLASGAEDNTIRLWTVATGACLAILSPLPEGWVAFSPDGRYKLGGIPAGGFWHVINLCRFEAGELDDWIPGLRLPDDASFFDLPPWTPEVRRPKSLRRERS